MLAIGRALVARPRLLLLDEPSLGLAPKFVTRIFQTLRELKKEGKTILLVEQNARQALQVADRGYVMERGRIVLSGSGAGAAEHARGAAHLSRAACGMNAQNDGGALRRRIASVTCSADRACHVAERSVSSCPFICLGRAVTMRLSGKFASVAGRRGHRARRIADAQGRARPSSTAAASRSAAWLR